MSLRTSWIVISLALGRELLLDPERLLDDYRLYGFLVNRIGPDYHNDLIGGDAHIDDLGI